MTDPDPDADRTQAARDQAAAQARQKALAWADETAAADRRRARRKKWGQIVIVGIFLVMLFERAVRGGLF